MPRRPQSKRSFTLLEVVLATALFAVVVTFTAMTVASVVRSWTGITEHSTRLEAMRKVDMLADTSFRNAIPFKWADDNNKERQIFVGDKSTATMACICRVGDPLQGGLRFVRIYLEEDGSLVAEYRPEPILFWKMDQQGEMRREVISVDVQSVSFLYADLENDELVWKDDWEDDVDNPNPNIPLAIQMEIEWKDGSSERWLRRTAGSGKFETYGQRKAYNNQ